MSGTDQKELLVFISHTIEDNAAAKWLGYASRLRHIVPLREAVLRSAFEGRL